MQNIKYLVIYMFEFKIEQHLFNLFLYIIINIVLIIHHIPTNNLRHVGMSLIIYYIVYIFISS